MYPTLTSSFDRRTSGKVVNSGSHTSISSQRTNGKSSYNGIIEQNGFAFNERVELYLKEITRQGRNKDGGKVVNSYLIGAALGQGQFGKVYEAKTVHGVVALKMIAKKPLNSQQFSMNQVLKQLQVWRNEGKISSTDEMTAEQTVMIMNLQKCKWELYILSLLHHKNVVQLIECMDAPESKYLWIVTELCQAGELQWKRQDQSTILPQWELMNRGTSPLSVADFAKMVLTDIADGLLYLKSKGCIHRDIKPSNILLNIEKKTFKISDFGCSVIEPSYLPFKHDLIKSAFELELEKIVGTPAFIAPELCFTTNPSEKIKISNGYQLDIWASGVTLYCIIFNSLPFQGENEFETYSKILKQPMDKKLISTPFHALVIEQMLEKIPSRRIDIETLHHRLQHKSQEVSEMKNGTEKSTKPVKSFLNKIKKFGHFKQHIGSSNKPSVLHFQHESQAALLPTPPTTTPSSASVTKHADNEKRSNVQIDNDSFESMSTLSSSYEFSSSDEPVQVSNLLSVTHTISKGNSQENQISNQESSTIITPKRSASQLSISSMTNDSPFKIPHTQNSSPMFSKSEELLPSLAIIKNSPLKRKSKHATRGLAHSQNMMDLKGYLRSDNEASEEINYDQLSNIKKYLDRFDQNN